MHHAISTNSRASRLLVAAVPFVLAGGAAAQLTWTQPAAAPPPARWGAAAACTLVSRDVIVFGGRDGSGAALGDTWRYDDTTWAMQFPAVSPSPRSHAAMAPLGANCALFGGLGANGSALGDLWIWSAMANDWSPGPGGPAPRERAVLSGGSHALLFGGRDGAQTFGDLWRLVLQPAPTWTNLTPATGPSPRHGAAIAHVARYPDHHVLFGGVDAAGNVLSDTWRLQQNVGGTFTWTQLSLPWNPGPRHGHAMRWSPHRSRVQLFGGEGPGGLLGDTWEWDGTQWLPMLTTGAPSPRADAVLVDGAHEALAAPYAGLLVGGRDAAGATAEVWEVASTIPASITGFGVGSAVIYMGTYMPWLGSTTELYINSLAPMVLPHLIAGFSNTTSPLGPLPIPLGAAFNNQVLLVDPVALLPLAPTGFETASLMLAFPTTPSLAGAHLFVQGCAWVPQLAPNDFYVTAGIDLQLGWR